MSSESLSAISKKILEGDRIVLSQTITLIESTLPHHIEKAQQILEELLPFTGKAIRIGVTGPPGVGKSTFIDALGSHLCQIGKKVAVLAIDPTSTISKGSILADKTRMHTLSAHSNAYIRPTSSGGTLGGVARSTRDTILLCEAAGFDIILVETVGVGQSETNIKQLVDFLLLLVLAGAGDEWQGVKRGIVEMADWILVNKADHDNTDKARAVARMYNQALHLFPPKENGWRVKADTCSALEGKGIKSTWDVIEQYARGMKASGWWDKNRKQQLAVAFHELIKELIINHILNRNDVKKKIQQAERDVIEQKVSLFRAAKQVEVYF